MSNGPVKVAGLSATLAAAGLLAVACGGGSGGQAASSRSQSSGGASSSSAQPAHLVNGSGQTLYLFANDKNGMSSCNASCTSFWLPVKAGTTVKLSGGATVKDSSLATTTRSDGSKQTTYDGHPLYRYVGDTSAGQENGQGMNLNGGQWWMVSASGSPITKGAPTPAPTSSKSGGGGYGGY